jgi:hypothetical protein
MLVSAHKHGPKPMKRALFLSLSLLVATLPAQFSATLPVIPSTTNVNVAPPFPAGAGRYQQWYSAVSLQQFITEPARINRLEFFAGTQPTSQAALIDCEIFLGHGRAQGLLGTFDSNWDDPANPYVVVRPRANVSLVATTAGSVCIDVPIVPGSQFTWDGVRPVVMEVRVYGNSVGGGAPFNYNFRGTTSSFGVSRVYAAGSALAQNGSSLVNTGMITRFSARPGVNLSYGTGCPGEGGFVPQARVNNLAWPGINWNHQIVGAASQQTAFWIIGDQEVPAGLLELGQLLGVPSNNCFLRASLIATQTAMTVGGGAGAGTVTLPIALPPTTSYVGASFYTQWVVFDSLAANGLLSVTNANRSIVAPIGG